jgi:hypothetical protein
MGSSHELERCCNAIQEEIAQQQRLNRAALDEAHREHSSAAAELREACQKNDTPHRISQLQGKLEHAKLAVNYHEGQFAFLAEEEKWWGETSLAIEKGNWHDLEMLRALGAMLLVWINLCWQLFIAQEQCRNNPEDLLANNQRQAVEKQREWLKAIDTLLLLRQDPSKRDSYLKALEAFLMGYLFRGSQWSFLHKQSTVDWESALEDFCVLHAIAPYEKVILSRLCRDYFSDHKQEQR